MYQPSITDEQVRRLYQLKLVEKKPMTKLIQEAVEQYLSSKQQPIKMEVTNEPRS